MSKRKFTFGGRKRGRAPSVDDERERRWAIAKLVRTIDLTAIHGGTCWLRSLSGSIVLKRLGIPHQLVLGGMIYRAGLNPWDLVMFASDDNKGHHPGLYHCWLESGDDLIDFSCGDWRDVLSRSNTEGFEVNPEGLPPITWKFPPPEFIWAPSAPLKNAWRPAPFGPKPREAWYGPIAEQHPEMLEEAEGEMLADLEECVDQVFLKFGLPVTKIFTSSEERDRYIKEHGISAVKE
jgi:hypothetical protein